MRADRTLSVAEADAYIDALPVETDPALVAIGNLGREVTAMQRRITLALSVLGHSSDPQAQTACKVLRGELVL